MCVRFDRFDTYAELTELDAWAVEFPGLRLGSIRGSYGGPRRERVGAVRAELVL